MKKLYEKKKEVQYYLSTDDIKYSIIVTLQQCSR